MNFSALRRPTRILASNSSFLLRTSSSLSEHLLLLFLGRAAASLGARRPSASTGPPSARRPGPPAASTSRGRSSAPRAARAGPSSRRSSRARSAAWCPPARAASGPRPSSRRTARCPTTSSIIFLFSSGVWSATLVAAPWGMMFSPLGESPETSRRSRDLALGRLLPVEVVDVLAVAPELPGDRDEVRVDGDLPVYVVELYRGAAAGRPLLGVGALLASPSWGRRSGPRAAPAPP